MNIQENKLNVSKIVQSVYEEFYESERRGLYDFPDKETWVKEQVAQHSLNNPELYGYVWDDETDDWILKTNEDS